MQQSVKVFTPELLAAIFPGLTVSKSKDFTYNINVDVINGDDLIKLVTVYLECRIDLYLCRRAKGIKIKITTHPDGYEAKRVFKIIPLEVID